MAPTIYHERATDGEDQLWAIFFAKYGASAVIVQQSDKVWSKEERKQAQIPYAYALRAQEAEEVQRLVADREEILRVFSK